MKRYLAWLVIPALIAGLAVFKADAAELLAIHLTPSARSMLLEWESNGADYYEIYRSGSRTGNYVRIGRTRQTTYRDNGLTPNQVYFYKIRPCTEHWGGVRYGGFSMAAGQCCVSVIAAPAVNNPCYRQNRRIAVQGLMLHSVGCSQESAAVFAEVWNQPTAEVLVHAVVDPGGSVYQLADWDLRCWHCGGAGNNNLIGVEMTEPNELRYLSGTAFAWSGDAAQTALQNYNTAVALFASLCFRYGLDPMQDICSHGEGGRNGVASGHGDPEHLWNGLGLSLSMDIFRADVQQKMLGRYEERSADACSNGSVVTVTAEALNIRSGPGTEYALNGSLQRGERVSVKAVKQGGEHLWGQLWSGDWISLTYTERAE